MRMLGDPYALSVRLAASEMLNHTSRCCRLRRRTRRELAARIASEHLVSDREPIAIDHQPHHHLFAIGTLIARMAELGLVVATALTLKIC